MPDRRLSADSAGAAVRVRLLRLALPLGSLALIAAGCGSLGGRYDSATTVPSAVSASAAPSGERAARRHRATVAERSIRVREHAPVARVANALCTPLVRYRRCPGPAGNGDRARPRAGSARRVPQQPHVPPPVALRPDFADGQEAHDARCARDVRAPAGSRDAFPGRRAVQRDRGLRRRSRRDAEHLRGVRPAAGRSRSRSSAPTRRSWRASRCRSRARSRPARRTARCRACWRARRPAATASSRFVRGDRPPARRSGDGVAERRQPGRGRTHLDHAAARLRRRWRTAIRSGDRRRLARRPARRVVAGARGAVSALAVLRLDPSQLAALGRARAAARCRWRSIGARWPSRRRRRACRPARCCSIRRRRGALPADPATARALLRRGGRRGDAALDAVGGAGRAGARRARDRGSARRDRGARHVRVASAAERPARGARLDRVADPAYGDPAAIFMPLADALADGPQSGTSRSACAARRGWPAMPAARPSGGSTSASAREALVRFRCCVQTFPRRSRPCWWEEAPIRCSISTSRCSPHDDDRTPTPQPAPAAVRDGPAVDLHGRGRRGAARSSARRWTSISRTATSAPSGARSPRRSCCTCARRRRAPCPRVCCRSCRPALARRGLTRCAPAVSSPPPRLPRCSASPSPAGIPPRRPCRRRRASCGRPRSSSAGTRATALDGRPLSIVHARSDAAGALTL